MSNNLKRPFKSKKFKFENKTAEIEKDSRKNYICLSACFTMHNFAPNDGVEMSDYQYNLFFSKIKMKIKEWFKRHFNNEIVIYTMEWPEPYSKGSLKQKARKKQYITIDIFMKEIQGLDMKKDYDKQIEIFLNEAYDIILNTKWFI